MQNSSTETQLNTLLHRPSRQAKATLEEWQADVATYLHNCLEFYDTHAHSPLRWDAVALGHRTLAQYHASQQLRVHLGSRAAIRSTPPTAAEAPTQQQAEIKLDDVRRTLMVDTVLNSEAAARLLTIANWVAESEPQDVGPVTYAMVAGARAQRQRETDWPSTRDLRVAAAPSEVFAGHLSQSHRWMRNIEKRFPANSIRAAPSLHSRWEAEDAHEHCARDYFSCLKGSAPAGKYESELRRYRGGPITSTAALACDKLKDLKLDSYESLDESQPLTPEILGLSTDADGTPEALYLALWNEGRAAHVRTMDLPKVWRRAAPEDRERYRQERIFSQIELAASTTDQLKGHRLFWRAAALGYSRASQFAISSAFYEDEKNHPFLKSPAYQQLMRLGDEAMQAEGLDPGVFGSIASQQMHVLQKEVRLLKEGPAADDEGAKQKILADARRLLDGILPRWPTLFDVPEIGDPFDWYADKCLRIATASYLGILDDLGARELLKTETLRIADWPHPWAAHAARRRIPAE